MKKYITENFQPRCVLEAFEDICAIPHGSGHEGPLGDMIIQRAERHGFEYYRDEAGNILIDVPATPGCEDYPSVLIQGHIDMVLAKEEGLDRDMLTEPVKLVLDGNILRADRTSLGADNGVGLCNMLAVLDGFCLRHPPMELLFTVSEETGLIGIQKFDMSRIKSRRMINMDIGDPDCLVIGSCGSEKYLLTKNCTETACNADALTIEISGLRGGHSGLEAGKNHYSALELAGRILSALCDRQQVRLVSLKNAGAGASIPPGASLVVAPDNISLAEKQLSEMIVSFRSELWEEKDLQIEVKKGHAEKASSPEYARSLADLLVLVPYDVFIRNTHHPDWILASALLISAEYKDGHFAGKFYIRANRDEYFDSIDARLDALCRICGAEKAVLNPRVPAWPERLGSPMQQACLDSFREIYGHEMLCQTEHGTIEVSIIAKAIPDMDIIGFAPKSRGAHTTGEHLYLDTVEPFWKHLCKLLDKLSV